MTFLALTDDQWIMFGFSIIFIRLSADLGLLFRHFYWKTVNTVTRY